MRRLILPLAIPLLLLAGCRQASQAPSTATTSDVAGAASTPFAYEEASVAELQKRMDEVAARDRDTEAKD